MKLLDDGVHEDNLGLPTSSGSPVEPVTNRGRNGQELRLAEVRPPFCLLVYDLRKFYQGVLGVTSIASYSSSARILGENTTN